MRRRQTVPSQWLIILGADDRAGMATAMRLPPGCGVLLIGDVASGQLRRLRRRRLVIAREKPGKALRVHNVQELRRALLRRTPLTFLSPIHRTDSHPDWKPIPRMQAAALARLGKRRLIALGGMDARKFARIENLGFQAWAGISAFRT